MPEDIDEIYTPRELLGFWDEHDVKKEDDPWDFSRYSPLRKSKARETTLAKAKEQALNTLVPMLLKGRQVLSARKLCRVARFKVRGMDYPDVEILLMMIDHVEFACAKRNRLDTSKGSFKGYAPEDWRYTL